MKLTPWFGRSIKPVHPGFYKTNFGCGIGWTYWNGKKWANQSSKLGERPCFGGAIQGKTWRGLAEKP